MRCFSKFDDLEKAAILNSLNGHENKAEQDIFLQGLLKIEKIKSRRPRKENPKSREYHVEYSVSQNGKRIVVCKSAFLSLYGLKPKGIRRLAALLCWQNSERE